ncbi:MAG: DegT/DnrJ/EryC1/StrS family aminotransferase [Candidatus Omnitrophica bacterium]|nr:DegT/DnrJ/EryC1/StrS family aminotransferase [Candidatus Omnitrophota bacterium]
MLSIKPFEKPIYVMRPLLPEIGSFIDKMRQVWDSGWLTNRGPQHQQLEESLKRVLKIPHVSLFNNGTIAMIVACQSLRLSGEVITTPFTFPATPHVLSWNGIKPTFCDIDPITMNIDPARIESLITPQTTAILAVHVFGTPCDVIKIQEMADRYGLKVVYDAAHAFGVEINGRGIGEFGDASMFSFHATKLFHTAEGGAVAVKNDQLKTRIDLLQNFGIKNEEEVIMPGINGKMNELQAAMGLAVLDYIEEERGKRQKLFKAYCRFLEGVNGISICDNNGKNKEDGIKKSYQYFVIRIDENKFGKSRDEVYEMFKKFNVFTRKYFYPLCSDYACYSQLPSSRESNLPVAHKVVKEVLCLPFYGGLGIDDVERICMILKSFQSSIKVNAVVSS